MMRTIEWEIKYTASLSEKKNNNKTVSQFTHTSSEGLKQPNSKSVVIGLSKATYVSDGSK